MKFKFNLVSEKKPPVGTDLLVYHDGIFMVAQYHPEGRLFVSNHQAYVSDDYKWRQSYGVWTTFSEDDIWYNLWKYDRKVKDMLRKVKNDKDSSD